MSWGVEILSVGFEKLEIINEGFKWKKWWEGRSEEGWGKR